MAIEPDQLDQSGLELAAMLKRRRIGCPVSSVRVSTTPTASSLAQRYADGVRITQTSECTPLSCTAGRGPWATIQWNTPEARKLPTFRIESLAELPQAIAKFNVTER